MKQNYDYFCEACHKPLMSEENFHPDHFDVCQSCGDKIDEQDYYIRLEADYDYHCDMEYDLHAESLIKCA